MFYSVSSTQKGLAGIDLGNFLIKQVRSGCRSAAFVCPKHLPPEMARAASALSGKLQQF